MNTLGLKSKVNLCLGYDVSLIGGAEATQQPNLAVGRLYDRINWALAGYGNLVPGSFIEPEPARISSTVTNTGEATISARKTTTIIYAIRGG